MGLYSTKIINSFSLRFNSERKLISEDFVFNLDFLEKASGLAVSSSCGYYYRDNANSLTKVYRKDRLQKQIFFTQYIIERTKNLGIYDKCEQRIYSTFLQWVRNIVKHEQRFYKEIGLKNSLINIKNVCADEFVIKALSIYDDDNLKKNAALLNKLIRGKCVFLIWAFTYVKDKCGV